MFVHGGWGRGPCGCEVLGCGFDVGEAPGDDGVGEQSDSFALDVLAVGVSPAELFLVRRRSAASLTSAVSCSTDVATSRGYALEPFGALSLQKPSGSASQPPRSFPPPRLRPLYSPRHSTSGLVRIRRDAPTRSPRRRPPCCKTTRNRYIPSKYSKDPRRLDPPPTAATRPMVSPALAVPFEWVSEGVEAAVVGRVING